MFDHDETIIVLAQNLRRHMNTIVVDTPFARDCTIEGEDFSGLLKVLRRGHLCSAREMRRILRRDHSMSECDANDLLEGLFDLHLITSNRRMPLTMEEISMNPSGMSLAPRTLEDIQLLRAKDVRENPVDLPERATPFMKLLVKRSSVRSFLKEEVSNEHAASLSRAALEGWGIHRSVPSAGGLYPCRVIALVRRGNTYHTPILQELSVRRVKNFFVPHAPCVSAPIYMIIVANYDRATKKYGARGWRYAILEAGHIAQNIELHALELGLATCEIGAFKESTCIHALKLSEMDVPLIVVAGGYALEQKILRHQSLSNQLIAAYVGSTGIVNSFQVHRYAPEFYPNVYSVRAQVAVPIAHRGKGTDIQVVGAEADTRDFAIVKAVAEGVERFSTGWIPPPEYVGRIDSIMDAHTIHPCELQKFSRKQSIPSRLATFTQESMASWYKVRKWEDDSEAYLPGDFLFYPYGEDGQKLYSYATSNGVAAHLNRDAALWGATSELLERESFLAWWFSGSMPPQLAEKETAHLDRFISAWREKSIELRFLDIGVSIPSVCVIGIDRKQRSAFAATAAGVNYTVAATHACSEVLRSISGWNRKTLRRLLSHKVRSVEDHLKCFAGGYAFDYIDAWSSSQKTEQRVVRFPRESDSVAWLRWVLDNVGQIFYHEFALPKSTFHDQPLVVIRSVIPGVVSIKFGYGEQDLGLPRLRKLMRICREIGQTVGRPVPKLHPLA